MDNVNTTDSLNIHINNKLLPEPVIRTCNKGRRNSQSFIWCCFDKKHPVTQSEAKFFLYLTSSRALFYVWPVYLLDPLVIRRELSFKIAILYH